MTGKRSIAKLAAVREHKPKIGDGGDAELSSEITIPTRDTDGLYACMGTFKCATDRDCIPCAYKIGCL